MRNVILVASIVFFGSLQCLAQSQWWNELKPLVVVGDSSYSHNLEDAMSEFNVHGVSIATIKSSQINTSNAFQIEKDGLIVPKAGTNHRFQAGSISKTVAALGVLVLVDKNDAISLDDPVNNHLKRWFVNDSLFDKPITIRQLLSHTAGLNVHGFPGYKSIKKSATLIEVLSGKGNTEAVRPIMPPDSTWKYSGGGYEILQLMVEDVSGMTFSEYLEKEVLVPLKMTNSTYELLEQDDCPSCAFAYDENGEKYKAGWYQYPESAAAGLWTTAEDLSTFFIHLGSIYKGESGVISDQMFKEMITPIKSGYGFGLFIEERNDGLYIGHSGKNIGFSNEALFNLKTMNGVVILTDSDRGFNLIQEIKRSVPGKDIWVQEEQIVIHPKEASKETEKEYFGDYTFKGPSGRTHKAKVFVKDGSLIAEDPNSGRVNVLISEGGGKYRERIGGTQVIFEIKDGKTFMHWGEFAQFVKS